MPRVTSTKKKKNEQSKVDSESSWLWEGFPQQFDMETTWEWSFMNAFLSE